MLKLFGGAVLEARGRPVRGKAAHKRRLALLAVLAVARRPVSREKIIGLLWPEHSSDSGRHLLSESLYVLRKELGEGAFVSAGDEVGLNGALRCDVAEFEAALETGEPARAAALYRGPFLDGFYVSGADDFERWAEEQRARYARAFAAALESVAESAEATGDPLRAAEWWRRLAAEDPYSSRVVLRLMQALDAAGERAAALRTAAAHARRMREELGVEPSVELAEAFRRLREASRPGTGTFDLGGDGAGEGDEDCDGGDVRVPVEEDAGTAGAVDGGDGVECGADAASAPPIEMCQGVGGEDLVERARKAGSVENGDTATRQVALSRALDSAPRVSERRTPAPALGKEVRYYGALTGMLIGFFLSVLMVHSPAKERRASTSDPRRIAVLYFDDETPGGDLSYLAYGLTEMLIDRLSAVPALSVVSRNGVKPYRGGHLPLDSLVLKLDVGTLVEGSLQRSGDSIRVTVRLVDAKTNSELQSHNTERRMGELFSLEDAITDDVTGFLRVRLGEEVRLSQRRRETESAAALDLVLRAEKLRADAAQLARAAHPADRRSADAMLLHANSLLVRARREDRRWAEPLVVRGWIAVDRAALTHPSGQAAVLRTALGFADSAARLQPQNPRAFELRGTVRWRLVAADPVAAREAAWLDGSEHDLRLAVEREPHDALAWAMLSQVLRFRGALAEAAQAAARAVQEDAFLDVSAVSTERMYRAALAMADYPNARRWCAAGRAEYPRDYRFVECDLTILARDRAGRASGDSAVILIGATEELDPPRLAVHSGRPYAPIYRRMMLAAVLARAGKRDSARAVMARARAAADSDPEAHVAVLYDAAYVQLLLGDTPASAAVLDSFVTAQPFLRDYVSRDPLFYELHPVRERPAQ